MNLDVGDTVFHVSGRWARVYRNTDEYETTVDQLTVIGVGKNGHVACAGHRASRGGTYIVVHPAEELFVDEAGAKKYAEDMEAEHAR